MIKEDRVSHMAIFVGPAIEQILAGKKTVEGRFSLSQIPPYQRVKKGDVILLKQSGGKIIGQVEVENVLFFDKLTGERIGRLRKEYSQEMMMPDEFWQRKQTAKYGSVIFLRSARKYLTPLSHKKTDRRPWVVLK